MQNTSFRSLVIVALLLLGLAGVYQLNAFNPMVNPDQSGFTYVADLDYWQSTRREQLVDTTLPLDLSHNLSELPLRLNNWNGIDVPETNIEVFILLEPEQLIRRRYRDKAGHKVWLTLIGGRKSRSFHPPDLCYDADGWQTELASQSIVLEDGGEIYGLWLNAHKDLPTENTTQEHFVFYFYLFPNQVRDQADGIVLFRLTSPRYGTAEETLAVQADFLRNFFRQATPIERPL